MKKNHYSRNSLIEKKVDKVANFFEKRLRRNDWEPRKSFLERGGVKVFFIEAIKDEREILIHIAREREEHTTVTIRY